VRGQYIYSNHFRAKPGHHISLHRHTLWQAELVVQGSLSVTFGTRTFSRDTGESILLPPSIPHGFVYGSAGATVFSVKMRLAGASAKGARLLDADDHNRALWNYLKVLTETQYRDRERFLLAMEHTLALLATCFFRQASRKTPRRESPLVSRIVAVLQKNQGLPVPLSFLSKQTGFSPGYLRTKFREATGTGLKQYIDRYRANIVANQIRYADASIKEIAWELGFPDVQTLSHFCVRLLGENPRTIRKKARQKGEEQ